MRLVRLNVYMLLVLFCFGKIRGNWGWGFNGREGVESKWVGCVVSGARRVVSINGVRVFFSFLGIFLFIFVVALMFIFY